MAIAELTAEELAHGFHATALVMDVEDPQVNAQAVHDKARAWTRTIRQQQFHLRLVALFERYPQLEAITVQAALASQRVSLSKMTVLHVDERAADAAKVKRKIEKEMSTLRGQVGANSHEVIYDVGMGLRAHPTYRIDRTNIEHYLSLALGPAYAARCARTMEGVLNQTVDAPAAPRARPRM
jgi:hypothetical protein